MLPTNRQTLSYLRTLFTERGIQPKNKLGQNFLVDLNLIDLVVRAAEITPADLVLEVGSGTGSLTMRLIEHAGAVVSVEIDPPFAALTREAVEAHYALFARGRMAATGTPEANVRLIHDDVLAGKNHLSPQVLEAVRGLLGRRSDGGDESSAAPRVEQLKLIANLPYAVAVPVISNLLLTDLPIERMVVTVQWEIAERLLAEPGTKDYGGLSILVQSLCQVTLLRRLAPAVFWPRPQVDSAIVLLRPDAERRGRVGDPGRFRAFLRDLYVHRRKNLRSALSSLPTGRLPKAEVDARLGELGIDGGDRAETLDVAQHLRLCRAFG